MQHAFVQNRDALLRRRCIQVAGNRRAGLRGADFLGCILRGQHGKPAIGHVAQFLDGAAEVEQLGQAAAVGRDGIHGTGVTARSSQGETEMLAVGTEGRRSGPTLGNTAARHRNRYRGAGPHLPDHEIAYRRRAAAARRIAFHGRNELSVRRNLNAEISVHQAGRGRVRSRRHLPCADASERRG